jgi:hypothetical protein
MLLPWRGRTNKNAFVERVQHALTEKFPEARVTPGKELELDIVFPNGASMNLYVGRAYAEFCKQPRDAAAIIARWLAHVSASSEKKPLDAGKIVPMIKDRVWVRSLAASAESWIEEYNEHLVVAYAEYNAGFHYCSRKDVAELGLPLDELRQRTLANLGALSTQRAFLVYPAACIINVGGNFEASQILLDEFWADPQIGERSLIAVPDRDSLALSVDDTPAAVWPLAEAAARLSRSQPYPITSMLFTRRDAGPMRAIDSAQEDENHPIPRLDVIDVNAVKRDGGADLAIVIASPLDASARSVFRLFTKIDGYLNEIASPGFRDECGPPSPETTRIVVHIHPESSREIFEVLEGAAPWVRTRNASLEIKASA